MRISDWSSDVCSSDLELVAALVDHLEEIVRRTGGVQGLQPLVAADAVVDVDHQVLLLQVGDLGEEVLGTAPALRRTRDALAEDVLLGEQQCADAADALLHRELGEPAPVPPQRGAGVPASQRLARTAATPTIEKNDRW